MHFYNKHSYACPKRTWCAKLVWFYYYDYCYYHHLINFFGVRIIVMIIIIVFSWDIGWSGLMAFQLTAQFNFEANKNHRCLHFARNVARRSSQCDLWIVSMFVFSSFVGLRRSASVEDWCMLHACFLALKSYWYWRLKTENWFCLEMCVRRVPIGSKWEYAIRNIRNAIVWEYWDIFKQIFKHLCTHFNVLEWLTDSTYRLIGIYLVCYVWWMEHLILEYHYYY